MMSHPEKMFFLDECGIQIHSRVTRGRAVVGINARKQTRQIRSKNISICAAIGHTEIYIFDKKDSAYNADKFCEFLTNFLQKLSDDHIEHAFIIMDNVPFHLTEHARNLIVALGHEAVYLPPYSPFLNPIENLFHQWKTLIRRQEPNNLEELYTAIDNAVEYISHENCINYFNHMQTYIPRFLRREVIED